MKILDSIRSFLSRKAFHILREKPYSYVDVEIGCKPFGRLLYLNIADMLTDLYAEVIWTPVLGYDTPKFKAWKSFVDLNGQRLLSYLLCKDGYAVIAYKQEQSGDYTFWQLRENAYNKRTTGDGTEIIMPKDPTLDFYILKSPTFEQNGVSDRELCAPAVEYIDNALNASSTVCKRLGTVVIASPKLPASATMPLKLSEGEKKDIEAELQKDYGALRKQNQIMLLPNEMTVQTVNLAGLDQRTQERVLLGVKMICDRLKVPANQVALIDANSNKALANGGELHEGDLAKYRSFKRLLNSTLFDMATEIGLKVNYIIENDPANQPDQTQEGNE